MVFVRLLHQDGILTPFREGSPLIGVDDREINPSIGAGIVVVGGGPARHPIEATALLVGGVAHEVEVAVGGHLLHRDIHLLAFACVATVQQGEQRPVCAMQPSHLQCLIARLCHWLSTSVHTDLAAYGIAD